MAKKPKRWNWHEIIGVLFLTSALGWWLLYPMVLPHSIGIGMLTFGGLLFFSYGRIKAHLGSAKSIPSVLQLHDFYFSGLGISLLASGMAVFAATQKDIAATVILITMGGFLLCVGLYFRKQNESLTEKAADNGQADKKISKIPEEPIEEPSTKISETKKLVWLSVAYCVALVAYRIFMHFNKNNIAWDWLSVVLASIVILLPLLWLCSEVELMGVLRIKRELKELKKEISAKLETIQTSVLTSITSQSMNPSIYVGWPDRPDPQTLQQSEKKIEKDNKSIPKNKRKDLETRVSAFLDVDQMTLDLFKARLAIEKRLTAGIRYAGLSALRESDRPLGAMQMLRLLHRYEIVDDNLENVLSEILHVCSKAVHGQTVLPEDAEKVLVLTKDSLIALEKSLGNAKSFKDSR